MGRKRPSGITRFTAVWLIIIVCIAIIWAAAMAFVTVALEEYEDVQMKYAAEDVFNNLFMRSEPSALIKYADIDESGLEEDVSAAEYLSTILGAGNLSYKEVISADSSVKMYAVSVGDITFASFTLGDGEEQTEILHLKYPELKKVDVTLKPLYGAVIFAPVCAEVRVNGRLLDRSYVEGGEMVFDPEPYYPDDDDSFRTFVNYTVTGLFAEPEVTASMPGGGELKLERDPDTGVYSAQKDYIDRLAAQYNELVLKNDRLRRLADLRREMIEAERIRAEEEERQRISDSIRAVYGDFVRDMARQYNTFIYEMTWKTGLKNNTLVYFKPGTTIYNYIANDYYNWGDFYLSTIGFTDEVSSEYSWVDDAHTKFVCRAQATVNMTGTVEGVYTEDTEYFDDTVYVDVSGGKPLVYALSAYAEEHQ